MVVHDVFMYDIAGWWLNSSVYLELLITNDCTDESLTFTSIVVKLSLICFGPDLQNPSTYNTHKLNLSTLHQE